MRRNYARTTFGGCVAEAQGVGINVMSSDDADSCCAVCARRALGGLAHVVSAEMHVEFLTPGVNKASAPCTLSKSTERHRGHILHIFLGVNQGAALAWLCAREGLGCAHAVTFGDNHNDAEMLRAAAPQGHKGVVTGPSRRRHSSLPWLSRPLPTLRTPGAPLRRRQGCRDITAFWPSRPASAARCPTPSRRSNRLPT